MVESLSKLAFFFRLGTGKAPPLPGKSAACSTDLVDRGHHQQQQFLRRDNKPVMRSPTLRHKRWSSLNQKRQMKDQNRVQTTNSVGTCSVGKTAALKPLPDPTGRSADVCKSTKVKVKSCGQTAKVNPLLSQLKYATDGMEAFIVLFQRLTADMDVFVLPCIKQELSNYKREWLDMKLKLEEADISCRRMKEEIEMQKSLHDRKLEELREIHSATLARLAELHTQELEARSGSYEKQLRDVEDRLRNQEMALQSKFNENLRQIQRQAEQKLESILQETKDQVEVLKLENDAWKEKLIKESWRKLEEVERKFKSKMERMETSYSNQLNEAEEEVRKREELFLDSMKRKPSAAESNREIDKSSVESASHHTRQDSHNLEEEICSLRVVLDLKHSEIQDLRKQNEKLRKDAQDLPFVSQKLDSAQARVEDLNAQLQTKIENEKRLLKENRKLLETVQYESEKKKRLTFQNEELLWKLKKSTQVAKTLAVFNSSLQKDEYVSESEAANQQATPKNTRYCRTPHTCTNGSKEKHLKRSRTDADIRLIESLPDEDASSPKVLGVVEKSDSVSWVLEIDESPLTVASRMLRRANSLRGVPSNKKKSSSSSSSSSPRHNQQSLTLPSRGKKTAAAPSSSSTPLKVTVAAAPHVDSVPPATPPPTPSPLRDDDARTSQPDDETAAIGDIASFFDFLQDSDFETDLVASDDAADVTGGFYEKGPTSPFSSTSSESSLDMELYAKESQRAYPRFTWTKANDAECAADGNGGTPPAKSVTDSSGLSDTEDSGSVDSFPSSSVDAEPTTSAVQSPTK